MIVKFKAFVLAKTINSTLLSALALIQEKLQS